MNDIIRYCIEILENKDSDNETKQWANNKIQLRINQLSPLFKECSLKGVDLSKLCPELNNEWNKIIMLTRKNESR